MRAAPYQTEGRAMDDDRRPLETGKLPTPLLERLLGRYAGEPAEGLVLGPGIGLDAAVIEPGPGYLLAKTDPITLVREDAALYALNVNANDIAVMGGTPRWFLATVLLPEGTEEGAVEGIFRGLREACRGLGVALAGGHTEVTPVVRAPVIVGQMLGEVPRERLVTAAGARPGDVLILTGGLAIEGTSIIARSLGDSLVRQGAFSRAFITRCARLLQRPGIGVLRAARAAQEAGPVHAMHDPTEGGLAAALHELSLASGRGMVVEGSAIPVLRSTRRLCRHLGIDPLGLIASGALLIASPEEGAGAVMKGLSEAGIRASVIGRVTEEAGGVLMRRRGRLEPLPMPERDELARIL